MPVCRPKASGAPGWNRTSDTRFRKPDGIVFLVVRRVRLCCTIQGFARAWCRTVLRRVGPWWGVLSAGCRQWLGALTTRVTAATARLTEELEGSKKGVENTLCNLCCQGQRTVWSPGRLG